jgi:HPt (histidine-containing phosphotransfer) domain-containing protein
MSRPDREPLLSVYEHDPEMAELVAMFVAEMPDRRAELEQAVRAADVETAIRIAHQLKGAAGGYGFDALGIYAAETEHALRALAGNHPSERPLRVAATPLLDACARVRLVIPQTAA